MYGNGVLIGIATTTVTIRKLILQVLTMVPAECIVAVAGAAVRGTVARRIATAAIPSTATTTLASAWRSSLSSQQPIHAFFFEPSEERNERLRSERGTSRGKYLM